MRTARLLIGVVGAAIVVLSVRTVVAQIDPRLPQGPNRELVARLCSGCHDLSNLYATSGRSRAGWDIKIDDMLLYGLKITPEQRALVLEYLATSLPP
jgi:hypothetical protein